MMLFSKGDKALTKLLSKMVEYAIARGLHVKCRDTSKPYLKSSVVRFPVEEPNVRWEVPLAGYAPLDYTAQGVHGKPWADPADPSACKFNTDSDGGINRVSYHGKYNLDPADGRPLNPFGRTGLRGRGTYGKWGPNHAADAIVSRFVDGQLQFVAIERHDTGELALPGGMLDKGEQPMEAAVREFREEALGNRRLAQLDRLWASGKVIYRGYVDDPRNTDNAWGETCAINFHDSDGLMADVQLEGGDDAKSAGWFGVDKNLKLYASHEYLVYLLAKQHNIQF